MAAGPSVSCWREEGGGASYPHFWWRAFAAPAIFAPLCTLLYHLSLLAAKHHLYARSVISSSSYS